MALLAGQVATANVYKCQNGNRTEYRDTPCHYQTPSAHSNTAQFKNDTKNKNNREYKIEGLWCQYATAKEKIAPRSVTSPRQWRFKNHNRIEFFVPGQTKKLVGEYKLIGNEIKISNSSLGHWLIKNYKGQTMTLMQKEKASTYRYLKRGQCITNLYR
ncbi:hypothetical protein C2869_11520 [Saccharobesus litoralis]|uniref:Uncharacterized protein n=1 Tax=Saccharobesus litoralis TaxID=2172099 RepID=A0A2S0VS48_9ALTE|nr:DUF4124 domain-containing protein [Saccharobesus litoralis]AWB67029.1 hypothetical protein C2869_11520 [Saccharobesus litoralis]